MQQGPRPARAIGVEIAAGRDLFRQGAKGAEVGRGIDRGNQSVQPGRAALQRLAFQPGNDLIEIAKPCHPLFKVPGNIDTQLEHRVEQRRLRGQRMQFIQAIPEPVGHALSSHAARAAASIVASSGAPLGTSQLPPTHNTCSIASQSGAVVWVIPPVGQNLA